MYVSPHTFTKGELMTKTACIAVVPLVTLGLCVAPFAMAATPKQTKMTACSVQANDKGFGEGKSDEREAFMTACLSAKPAMAGGTQQNKMKSCNKEAGVKGLKREERKKFMSACLSN